MRSIILAALAASIGCAAPAGAQEVFAGAYVHGVNTPFSLYTGESGLDVAAGYRLAPVEVLSFIGRPEPYVIASLNTGGETSFAGAGLSWTIGKGAFYLRPAIAVIVHDGPDFRYDAVKDQRTELGSRVLFEPEIALGYRLDEQVSIEASWMHISQGRVFNYEQNPGIDMFGARLNYRLGR